MSESTIASKKQKRYTISLTILHQFQKQGKFMCVRKWKQERSKPLSVNYKLLCTLQKAVRSGTADRLMIFRDFNVKFLLLVGNRIFLTWIVDGFVCLTKVSDQVTSGESGHRL